MSAAVIGRDQAAGNVLTLSALKEVRAWLCWRLVRRPGEKPRKVPFWAAGGARAGEQGGDEDRRHLVTYAEAQAAAAARNMQGIGLALLPELGISVIDFDRCMRDGQVLPEVEAAVAGTYAEFSPSDTGAHAFVRGTLGNRKDAHGEPFGVETFSSTGYVTFTDRPLPIVELTDGLDTIAPPSPELLEICAVRFGAAEAPAGVADGSEAAPLGLSTQQLRDALAALDPSMSHDPWLRVGMALHHETRGEGFELWDEWSAGGVQYPGTEALAARWDSFGRGNQRPVTAHYLAQLAGEHGHIIDLAATVIDDFEVLADAVQGAQKPLKYPLVTVRDLLYQKPPAWLVKDVVPQAELMVIFGESGSGKSFVVLDIFAAVALGVPWLGQATKQGRVIYIVAEGRTGFGKRVQAYCRARSVDVDTLQNGFAVIADTPNLLQRDDAAEIVRSVATAGGASVVVVDTLAQTTPGANENAAEDMGKALANCKAIHRATGALVVLVHHTGKDQSRGARGWSGLKAAADAEIEISKTVAGRAIRVSKQKDGEDGRQWGFELDQVAVGTDASGDAITSCVIREVAPPVRHQVARLGKWQRAALDAVTELGGTGAGAKEAQIITAAIQVEAAVQGKRDRRAEYVRTALAELVERCVLEVADGAYRIA